MAIVGKRSESLLGIFLVKYAWRSKSGKFNPFIQISNFFLLSFIAHTHRHRHQLERYWKQKRECGYETGQFIFFIYAFFFFFSLSLSATLILNQIYTRPIPHSLQTLVT